jgi:hypothetical protein
MPDGKSPFADQPTSPRLSILHLLLWMLFAAVYFGVVRLSESTGLHPDGSAIVRTTSILYGMIGSAGLTGGLVVVVSRVRGQRMMLEHAGHWMLLVQGTWYVNYLIYVLVTSLSERFSWGSHWNLGLLTIACTSWLPVAIYGTAITTFITQIQWRVYLGAAMLHGLFETAAYVFLWFGTITPAAMTFVPNCGWFTTTLLLIAAIIIDLCRRERRDWLHWAGAALLIANMAVYVIWIVGVRLLKLF